MQFHSSNILGLKSTPLCSAQDCFVWVFVIVWAPYSESSCKLVNIKLPKEWQAANKSWELLWHSVKRTFIFWSRDKEKKMTFFNVFLLLCKELIFLDFTCFVVKHHFFSSGAKYLFCNYCVHNICYCQPILFKNVSALHRIMLVSFLMRGVVSSLVLDFQDRLQQGQVYAGSGLRPERMWLGTFTTL